MDDMSPESPVVVPNGDQQPFKRNRQAPAKTFQCRGYGECRMVFSRSEHLARHIRYTALPPPFVRTLLTLFSKETHRRTALFLSLLETVLAS